MSAWFDIEHIFFSAWGYQVSYLEFFGMVSGVIAVFLSALANVYSWPVGIINVVLSFFLFYQVQLYPDMFLQVFFFVTNVIGWWRWTHPKKEEEDRKHELRVSWMNRRELVVVLVVGLVGTAAFGYFAGNLHHLFPAIFTKPSAAPYLDSFITVVSVVATYYMIQKKIECWIMWLMIDVLATYLYFVRDIKLYSLLYLAFCFIAGFALWNWIRKYRSYRLTVK
jgi:nicotinamide mononucleotide transporter